MTPGTRGKKTRMVSSVAVVAACILQASLGMRSVVADAVLTPTAVLTTPEVTVAPPTPVPTTTPPPTVAEEQTTPIITVSVPATPTPLPPTVVETEPPPTTSGTPHHDRPSPGSSPKGPIATNTAASTPTPISVSPTDTAATPSQAAPDIPPPSPSQLRESARLRWGTHVPAAVRRWAFLIVPAAKKYGISPNLVAAVMTLESGGDPRAWSRADARGLMQVLHGPWDPQQNVDEGVRMLAEYWNQFHDLTLTLAAYNAGLGAVLKYGGVPPYRETRDYVIIVSYLYDLFSHHRLTHHRRAQYQHSLTDLERVSADRKKVARLKHIFHVQVHPIIPACLVATGCVSAPRASAPTQDPFWPVSGSPDPLQRVDPFVGT